MSELAVSNDVLRESLRVAAPPPLGTRLEQRMSTWLPTFERWLIGALDWFSGFPPWQRGALSVASGVVLGLSIVFALARVSRTQRPEVAAVVTVPTLSASITAPRLAPIPAPSVAPGPAPGVSPVPAPAAAAPQPAASEPLLAGPESRHASKRAKKRSRLHHRAPSNTGWMLSRPQRASLAPDR